MTRAMQSTPTRSCSSNSNGPSGISNPRLTRSRLTRHSTCGWSDRGRNHVAALIAHGQVEVKRVLPRAVRWPDVGLGDDRGIVIGVQWRMALSADPGEVNCRWHSSASYTLSGGTARCDLVGRSRPQVPIAYPIVRTGVKMAVLWPRGCPLRSALQSGPPIPREWEVATPHTGPVRQQLRPLAASLVGSLPVWCDHS